MVKNKGAILRKLTWWKCIFACIWNYKAVYGIIIMIPVGIIMALSYFFNRIYLGIMCLLEKKNKLQDKAELCETLDKLSPVLAGIVTVIFCIMVIKGM